MNLGRNKNTIASPSFITHFPESNSYGRKSTLFENEFKKYIIQDNMRFIY